MVTPFDNEYECFTCTKIFRDRVFEISREWDRVHFECEIPEVEVQEAYGLECYCSRQCLLVRRAEVMASEGVPICPVGTGPIEMCAKCGGPVDMSEFHLTYLEDESKVENLFEARTVSVDYLAVICRQCHPLTLATSESFVVDEDSETTIAERREIVATKL